MRITTSASRYSRGEIEVTIDGKKHRLGAGEHVVIERGRVHSWRNASSDRTSRSAEA